MLLRYLRRVWNQAAASQPAKPIVPVLEKLEDRLVPTGLVAQSDTYQLTSPDDLTVSPSLGVLATTQPSQSTG